MAELNNFERLVAKLRDRAAEARKDEGSVVVGYTASYAIYVHENRQARHPVGRAGFLLDVAREIGSDLRKEVEAGMKAGLGLARSLLRAGLLLQRTSQQNCPIDTGNLRASAFTRAEPK